MVRIFADGTIDPTFQFTFNDAVFSLGVDSDGRLLAGGFFTEVNGQRREGIARISEVLAASIDGPAELTARLLDDVTFTVTVTGGRGTLSYQWSHNGIPIVGATSPTLLLERIVPKDAGEYAVTVTSRDSTVTSAPVQLKVQPGRPATTPGRR